MIQTRVLKMAVYYLQVMKEIIPAASAITALSISNNGLLVRAITDILFYIDLIGTMVEIN